MELAIDTATDNASLALAHRDDVLAELTWHSRQNHSTQLLPSIVYLLNLIGVSLQSLEGIIVAQGPGSYNGLRVGISTAKGLVVSLGIPIVGISTLEAAAFAHAQTNLPICPILNAGRGEIATATYRKRHHQWCQLTATQIITVDQLCTQVTTRTVFCGELTAAISTQLSQHLKQKAIIPPVARLRRAGFLAILGQQRLGARDYDNPATLQPIYLRQPTITTPKRNLTITSGDRG